MEATPTLEARVARLERLLGIEQPDVTPVERKEAYGEDRLKVGAWLDSRRLPGEVLSVMVVMLEEFSVSSVMAWDATDPVRVEAGVLRKAVALCEALSSEVRLAIIQELFAGPQTTAQLLQAVALDRGQLYHHLRDLFVHGLVAQPERGRYKATDAGRMILLAASQLTHIEPELFRTSGEIDMGE